MANNSIALGIRAPQSSGVNNMVQQNAALINQMTQAAAQQRQAAQLQQKMQFDAAQEARQAKTNDIDYATKVYEFHRQQAPAVQNPQTYSLWLQGVAKDSPETAAMFAQSLPADKFEASKFNLMLGKMDDVFKARFGTATTGTVQNQYGDWLNYNASSIPGGSFSTDLPNINHPLTGTPPRPKGRKSTPQVANVPTAPAANVPPARAAAIQQDKSASDMIARIGGEAERTMSITPENVDLLAKQIGPHGKSIVEDWAAKRGITIKPISFSPDQGVVAPPQGRSEQMPQNYGGLSLNGAGEIPFRQNGGYEMPQNYGGLSLNGAADVPFRQNAQYAPGAYQGVRGRPPVISPQSNPAPAPVVQANAAAEEAGKGRTARLEKLRSELPQARAAAQATISAFDQQINTIDEFLRHPYHNSIVGAIEGRLPSFLQDEDRADVQAKWDRVRNGQVIQQIIDDRQKTGTGASPLGNMSNSDLNIYMKAGSALTQTGNERTQEIEMMKTRDKLMEGRNRAIQVFNDAFHEVANTQALLNPPPIARKYSPGTSAPSPQDIATLRRNRNNSQFTDGFKRHFGVQAFNAAMGGQ